MPEAGRPIAVGDRVRRANGPDYGGVVAEIFETPWDTANRGAGNTRTVARVDEPRERTYEHVFVDQLVRVVP